MDAMVEFWKNKLGVDTCVLAPKSLTCSSRGQYVDKFGDRYLFFWEDLRTGAKVLAGSTAALEKIAQPPSSCDHANIRKTHPFSEMKIAFKDVDYLFPTAQPKTLNQTIPPDYKPTMLTTNDHDQITEFFSDCSEDDRDTLDLTFEGETAIAFTNKEKIAAIVRYLPVPGSRIADLTVVVRQSERGKKLSTPLVAHAIDLLHIDGLVAKYRVDEDLTASRRIAEKLGMTPHYQILAWEIPGTTQSK